MMRVLVGVAKNIKTVVAKNKDLQGLYFFNSFKIKIIIKFFIYVETFF